MLTDDDLRRELTVVFHEQADPIARTAIEPAALFQRALWQRRRRAAARAGAVLAVAVAAILSLVTVAGRPAAGPATTAGPGRRAARRGGDHGATGPGRSARHVAVVCRADHGRPVAIVRDSVTGRLVSTVDLSAGTDPKLTQVTAAGDDRTFVLAVFSLSRGTRFFELRITPSGRPAGLPGWPSPRFRRGRLRTPSR